MCTSGPLRRIINLLPKKVNSILIRTTVVGPEDNFVIPSVKGVSEA